MVTQVKNGKTREELQSGIERLERREEKGSGRPPAYHNRTIVINPAQMDSQADHDCTVDGFDACARVGQWVYENYLRDKGGVRSMDSICISRKPMEWHRHVGYIVDLPTKKVRFLIEKATSREAVVSMAQCFVHAY